MTEDQYKNRLGTIIAGSGIYYFILHSFIHLPDKKLIEEIKSPEFLEFLDNCYYQGNNTGIKQGINHIKAYRSRIGSRKPDDVLNELSIDRTRLLRGTVDKRLKPPYESLYIHAVNSGDIISFVKNDYRKAGILPDEDIGEMLDYLGVELDFMYQLCLREEEQRKSGEDAITTVVLKNEFLNNHLGRWIDSYCGLAEPESGTDFFRGLLKFLNAFINTEIQYLHHLK